MPTPHIESSENDIAKIVLMPGDPKRAQMIADNYLTNVKLVNSVRGMTAYTGYYKDKEVTVFPSGMGIPSMGIYSYELFKFYGVEKIIRIGTCGSNREDVKILDVVLAESSYSLSTFANLFGNFQEREINASETLNNKIKEVAINNNINLKIGKIITSDVFDVYIDDKERYFNMYPSDLNTLASEMESFALFYMAKLLNKDATCLLTVVDSKYEDKVVSSDDRQNSLNDMIKLALDSIL